MSSIEIFYSYSHEDEALRDELEKHLKLLKRQGYISTWHDRRIIAGQEWAGEIDNHLKTARIILLLVSPDFLASDYCFSVEIMQAVERHERGEACVIPVILRPVHWQDAPFGKLQALPKDAKPVISWPKQDEAFYDVTEGIRKVVAELRNKFSVTPATTAAEQPDIPVPTTSMPRWRATFLLICLCVLVGGVLWDVVLVSMQKLPSLIGAIAAGVQVVSALAVVAFGIINGESAISFLKSIWKNAYQISSLLVSLSVVSTLALALIFVTPSSINGNSGNLLLPFSATTSPVNNNSGNLFPSASATMMSTTHWRTLLKQKAPNCNNPAGTSWSVHKQGTHFSCSSSYLLMQRISPDYYADMELAQVNNDTYNQTSFSVQVQVTFQNPTGTSAQAAVLVQTPAQSNAVGGYLFTLDSMGRWNLQNVIAGTNIPTVKNGQASINPGKPTTMTVIVKDGLLVGYINGQSVVSYNDSLNPSPGQVGLLVMGPEDSSPILYSNFELAV
jgi:hypothetical protein